jgi:anti-sigma factor RsiW
MNCREFEALVVGARDRDRSPADMEALARHARHCPGCAALQAQMERVEAALDGLAPAPAPAGFSAAVLERVRATGSHRPAPWHERLLGALRPPTPLVAFPQAAAVAALVLMIVSAGVVALHQHGTVAGPSTVAVAEAPGGPVIEMDSQFADALVAAHQSAAAGQPLSDDESMRLVSY